jgi:hypothetical protein
MVLYLSFNTYYTELTEGVALIYEAMKEQWVGSEDKQEKVRGEATILSPASTLRTVEPQLTCHSVP